MKKDFPTKYDVWHVHLSAIRLSLDEYQELGRILDDLPKIRTTSQGYFVKVIKKGDFADYHFTLNHKWRIITLRKVVSG